VSCSGHAGPPIHRCSSRIVPTKRVIASSFGKMPTNSVLRLTSPLMRSSGLVECRSRIAAEFGGAAEVAAAL